VARKKRKKRSWRRTLLIFTVTPLAIWFVALILWFFWDDMMRLVAPPRTPARPGITSPRDGERAKERQPPQPAKAARESIPDEDRKKLDDILKRR
jgi:hypothetical protein